MIIITVTAMAAEAVAVETVAVVRALFAGVVFAAVAGALGCFLVWRRAAYFGDSLAHGALLGVALGLALGANVQLAAVLACALFAPALLYFRRQGTLADDAALGILAHSSLAFALLALHFSGAEDADLHTYLFGDILAVTAADLLWTTAVSLPAALYLYLRWQPLTLMTLHEDLAACEGVRVSREHFILTLLTAIVVAAAVRIVGALLIASLLIIPAAAARQFARTPTQMAAGAAGIGALAVVIGVGISLLGRHGEHAHPIPAGPVIVAACAALFALSTAIFRGGRG